MIPPRIASIVVTYEDGQTLTLRPDQAVLSTSRNLIESSCTCEPPCGAVHRGVGEHLLTVAAYGGTPDWRHATDPTIADLRYGRGVPGVMDAASLRLALTDEERAQLLAQAIP